MSNYTDLEKRRATQRAWRLAHPDSAKASARLNYVRHRDAIKAKAKAYQEANYDKVLEYHKQYYIANMERMKADAKARRAALPRNHRHAERLALQREWLKSPGNRAKANAWTKAWRQRYPEKHRDKVARRRARVIGTQVERVNLRQILVESNGLCGICKKPLDLFGIHFDHIVPLSAGGAHTTNNIQATHAHCNQLKGARVA